MRSYLGTLFVLAALCKFALAQTVDQSGETSVVRGSPKTIELARGVPMNVVLDETPGGVTVGNPEIADVNITGNRSIVIVPKKVGMTAVIITDKSGRLIARITVPVNDPNTVSIWENGDRTNAWCTSEICLNDAEVKKKNNENQKSDNPPIVINLNNTQEGAGTGEEVTPVMPK